MELETLFGLPAHPLLVHLPVVLLPLAALLTIAAAVRPRWIDRFGWVLVVLAGVGALGAVLAAGSGEELEESVDRTSTLRDHAELGEVARLAALLFFLVVTAVVVIRWWMRSRQGAERLRSIVSSRAGTVALSIVLVVGAVASTVTVVLAGHAGAKATWEDVELIEEHDDEHEDDGD